MAVKAKTEVLDPEDVLPRMSADTEEMTTSRAVMANEVRQRLVLDPSKMSFISRGVTVITWRDDVGLHELEIPIKSLTAHESDNVLKHYRNEIPPEDAPDYLVVMTEMALMAKYDKLLLGFDGDIMSEDGERVVWSSTTPELCDRDLALKSLYALQIPGVQLDAISDAIDALSLKTEMEKADEFKKKQPPP